MASFFFSFTSRSRNTTFTFCLLLYIFIARARNRKIFQVYVLGGLLSLSLSLFLSPIFRLFVRFLVVWWEKKRKKNLQYTINIIKPLYTIYYNQTWTLRLQYMYFRIGISTTNLYILYIQWWMIFTSFHLPFIVTTQTTIDVLLYSLSLSLS